MNATLIKKNSNVSPERSAKDRARMIGGLKNKITELEEKVKQKDVALNQCIYFFEQYKNEFERMGYDSKATVLEDRINFVKRNVG